VVTDLRMPGLDGWQFFAEVALRDADIPVILITGHGNISDAVAAMHQGAYDFVAKPFAMDRLLTSIGRALEKRRLVLDNRWLRAVADDADHAAVPLPLVGDSPAMLQLRATLAQIGEAEIDTLIEGEPGTGRDRIARLLHDRSRRRMRAFASVNCAAATPGALEDELFGTESGAAARRRIGRMTFAHRGTLFLDAVESLPIATQLRLNSAFESGEFVANGGNEPRRLDLRVIAATDRDPGLEVAAGRLRAELMFRLGAIRIRIPPLRERREDVPLLFGRLAADAARRFNLPLPALDAGSRAHLLGHDWPGNLQELGHFAERSVLGLNRASAAAEMATSLPERMATIEAGLIREALATARGGIAETQRLLGLPRKTLYDKLKRHKLDPASFRRPGRPR
jgi:two-component system C4-dicarboxylate transport response regulator DctD